MNEPIKVTDFSKVYGELTAVDGISFSVKEGEVFGLLGPNGAGKTTTLECLEGLRTADGGKLDVLGVDPVREPARLRRLIGVQLQSSGLPESITVKEVFELFSAYHKVHPRCQLLERMGLMSKVEAQYHTLSTGQQRRLALALSVAHDPRVLFLDEPTAGLDVATRAEVHMLMAELKKKGTTIILSTHDMAEAEAVSDRVAILLKGKLVAEGSPREITATGSGLTRVSVRTTANSLAGREFPAVLRQMEKDNYQVYFSNDIAATVGAVIAAATGGEDSLIDLRVERPTLEERFLELTAEGEIE